MVKIIKTKDRKIGFFVETISGKIHTIYANLNPDSNVAKSLIRIFDLAKTTNINSISLPKNTKIGEVGLSGEAKKTEILILQYGLKE